MAGGGGGGQEGGKENTYFILWVIFLVAVIMFGIWYFFSEQLVTAFIYIRKFEILAIQYALYPLQYVQSDWSNAINSELQGYYDIADQLTADNITPDAAQTISEGVGKYLRFPIGLILAQLGRAWQVVQNMAIHRRAIFAILAARGCRNSKVAQALVYQLADSAGGGKINYKGCEELWQKHIKEKLVKDTCDKHAYEFT